MDKIGNLVSEQEEKVQKVLQTSEKMAAVSQETAAGVEEIAASSQEQKNMVRAITDEASKLSRMAGEFMEISEMYSRNFRLSDEVMQKVEFVKEKLIKLAGESFVVNGEEKVWPENFEKIRRENPAVLEIVLLDEEGNVKFSTGELPIKNLAFRPWFQKAVKGQVYISKPYIDIASNRMTVTVSAPIIGDGGRIMGVLAIDVDIS
ncbi:cache domain-containing protein [Caldanaerovirga acetigignens]